MGVLDFLAFKPTPLYRSMIADSGVPLPDLNSLRVNIIKGFAKTASLIGTALESENYQSLIGITGHLFSDRPLPITLASLNDPKLKSQFDDVAEQVRDKWFEASWDEANQVAYETTTHIPSTYTFNTIYENTIESLLPANVYSDSKSVIDRIDVMARDAIKRRVNFLSLIVDGMTRPETVDISRSSDLKPKEIGGWVVGIVEIIGVTLTSNDLSKDLVVGHALCNPDELTEIYLSKPRSIDYNKFVLCWLLGHEARTEKDLQRAARQLSEVIPAVLTHFLTLKKN